MQNQERVLKHSGAYVFLGGLMLVIELVLIQLDILKVELPDHKLDLPTIFIAIAAWTFLFIGIYMLSRSPAFAAKRKVFYITLAGLAIYTVGCIVILAGLWELMFIIPAGLLTTAIGATVAGVSTIRLADARSFGLSLLCIGLYPFVCMFPVVMIKGSPNYSINYAWGILWCSLGVLIFTKQNRFSKIV